MTPLKNSIALAVAASVVLVASAAYWSSEVALTIGNSRSASQSVSTLSGPGSAQSGPEAFPTLPGGAVVGPLRVGTWTPVPTGNAGISLRSMWVDDTDGSLRAVTRQGWIFRSTDSANSWQPDFVIPWNLRVKQLATVRTTGGLQHQIVVRDDNYLSVSHDGWRSEPNPYPSPVIPATRVKTIGGTVIRIAPGWLDGSSDGGVQWSYLPLHGLPMYPDCLDVARSASGLMALCKTGAIHREAVEEVGYLPLMYTGATIISGRLAVAPSNASIVYASVVARDHDDNVGIYIYRSVDAGETWDLRSAPGGSHRFNDYLLGDFDSECGNSTPTFAEDYAFTVDPADPDVLWVGARDLYRSDDAGQIFQRAGHGNGAGPTDSVGTGIGDIVFLQEGGTTRMLLATDDGAYSSDNPRAAAEVIAADSCNVAMPAQVQWQQRMSGFVAQNFLAADSAASGEVLASVEGGGGGVMYGNLGSDESWSRLSPWTPTQIVIDPQGLDRFYMNNCGTDQVCRWTWNPTLDNWDILPSQGIDPDASYRQVSLLIRDPNDPTHFKAAQGEFILSSHDAMATWQYSTVWRSPDGRYPHITAGAISPARANLMVVGDEVSSLLFTNYAGDEHFGLSGQVGFPSPGVTSMMFDPARPERIYALRGATPALKRSTDGLDNWINWTDLDTWNDGLEGRAGHALAIDPDNSDVLYLGTDNGLFVRGLKVGADWLQIPAPFPNTKINRLIFRRQADGSRILYAFTEGRGVWALRTELQVFTDVSFSAWSFESVNRLQAAGITNGCATSPVRYCPGEPVLRSQMAAFLLRATHGRSYAPPAASGTFADVPSDHWAVRWIEQLRADGVTNGCATDPLRYCPEDVVPREQIAVFLLRAKYGAAYQPPAATGRFVDVPATSWAAAWIEQLAREGIANGCSLEPAMYCPADPVTREQMAAFLVRTFQL